MKNKTFFLLIIFSILFFSCIPPDHPDEPASGPGDPSPEPHLIEWQKCLGGTDDECAYSVSQTADNGYIIGGNTESNDGDVSGNHGESDFWIVKLDMTAAVQWQKCLGGSAIERLSTIMQTTDSGYITCGRAASNDGDVAGNHGGDDFWVVKLNASGIVQWQKCLGGSGDESALSVQQTADGGYIVAGYTESNDGDVSGNHGGYDSWVVKLDWVGTLQWQKILGGTLNEFASSIQQTLDDGYIVSGSAESNDGDVSGNHGNKDFWIVKLDFLGTMQWQKCLGGTERDTAHSVAQTKDGGYIVSGETFSSNGDVQGYHGGADYWVIKLYSTGTLQWQRCLGGSVEEEGSTVRQTKDNGYIVVGQTNGDVPDHHGGEDTFIVKLDPAGIIEWQKCLGGTNNDTHIDIRQTSDGGYIMAGFASSDDGDVSGNHGGEDFWVLKLTN